MKNIAVIGAGYVGLVTAACFAELGHNVNLLEINAERISALERGELPINEPGLPEIWRQNQTAGRMHITGNYMKGLLGAEFAFIAVGTPSASNGKPDLRWVKLAAKNIAEAASGPLTVVVKSTVPVGTSEIIAKTLTCFGHNGHRFSIVSNPEFLREGSAVYDFMNPTRVVIGASDIDAKEAVAGLFKPLNSTVVMCDNRTAEMSKYASNVFLATRISFMNEMALLCDEYGVDVVRMAEIMGLDPRFGKGYLNAGLGWGGSCLPKDVRGLIHMGKSRGVPLKLVRAVQQVNQLMTHVVVRKLRYQLGSLEGKTIGILGLSFKPDSDDMREARSLKLIPLLEEQACRIKAYDPVANGAAARLLHNVTFCSDSYEVAKGSDALILVTEWDEFKTLDMRKISSLMNHPIIIDGRNIYNPEEMAQAGFTYAGIGRQGIKPDNPETMMLVDKWKEREPVASSKSVVSQDYVL
jgi:UDPglucose 6-dehydrogenase